MLPYEVADNGDGTYTVTNNASGAQIVVDEEALQDLTGSLGTIKVDLEGIRDLVTNGNTFGIHIGAFSMIPDIQFQRIDALNLKLGGFDDAIDLQTAYRENFYKGKADQVERISHGYATGQEVSQDIMQNYTDQDGNVAADVDDVQSQFVNSNGITESEVTEGDDIPSDGGDLPSEGGDTGDSPQH